MDPPFFNEGDEGTGRAKGSIGFANTFFVIPANAWNPERKPTKNGPPLSSQTKCNTMIRCGHRGAISFHIAFHVLMRLIEIRRHK